MTTLKPWWQTDAEYVSDEPVPDVFNRLAGPQGVALVRAWPDGRTDPGWGLVGGMYMGAQREGFAPRYARGEFNGRRVLHGFIKGKWAFAFVMRSVKIVCIDIDGKNGGLEHAKRLGALPLTLAETSKSGTGYHLFYEVDEEWDDLTGFGLFADRIGLEQGVDIRATGCVYHHPQQRWNGRKLAKLPQHLYEQLKHREDKILATSARIRKVLTSEDEMEIIMMHDELLTDLAKPIAPGKRNNTLFAIGQQMQEAQVPDWETLLVDRATQVGLDSGETDKLVANIKRYAPVAP